LSEAPDPYPLLEASVDSLVTAEEIVPQLQDENQQLHAQVRKLTAQLEESESRLDLERQGRQRSDNTLDQKLQEVEASYTAVLNEKQSNWEAREKNLEERVENQDRLLKELKANYEVSQRLDRGDEEAQSLGRNSAAAAELEIVSSELDRANQRLAELQARNEQLRLEGAQSASQTSQQSGPIEENPAFLRLQSENSSLLRKLDAVRLETDTDKSKLEANMRALEREITSVKAERTGIKDKIQKMGDYEDLKQELEVLKSIEFATGDNDDDAHGEETSHQNGIGTKPRSDNLEQLLHSRNKKLNNDLTLLRVSHQDLESRLSTLQDELSSANMELEQARNLNATLELDLQKVQQEASNAFASDTLSVAGTYRSKYPASSMRRSGGRSSPTSSIISGFDNHGGSSGYNTMDAIRAGEPVGGGSGILPMVAAQRDRFKKRNAELESELQKSYQTVSSLRSEVAGLQKDNLNLYEKTRYVSTYNRTPGGSSSGSFASRTNPSTLRVDESTNSGLTLDRYRSQYEHSLSPFAAFRSRESTRVLKRMTLPERMVFQITKLIMATRTSRNLFAAYCVALHLLVLLSLYWMGTVDIEQHSASLGGGAAALAGGAGKAAAANGLGGGGGGGGAGAGLGAKDWQPEAFDGKG
jgi:homeobox protein cut-like